MASDPFFCFDSDSPSRACPSSPPVWCTGTRSAWPGRSCRSKWFPTVVPPSTPDTRYHSDIWISHHTGWGPPSSHLQNNIMNEHSIQTGEYLICWFFFLNKFLWYLTICNKIKSIAVVQAVTSDKAIMVSLDVSFYFITFAGYLDCTIFIKLTIMFVELTEI